VSGSDLIFAILFWILACKHDTWSSLLFGLFWDARGANCLLSHPFPTRSPTRLNHVKLQIGSRCNYSLGRINWHNWHKGWRAKVHYLFIISSHPSYPFCSLRSLYAFVRPVYISLPGTLFIPWASADDCRTFILSRYFFELFHHTHSVSQTSAWSYYIVEKTAYPT